MVSTARTPIQTCFYPLPARVQQVSVDGDCITGLWESPFSEDVKRHVEGGFPVIWPPRLPQPGEMAWKFVNVRGDDLQSIARFTAEYGPLEDEAAEGKRFQFSATEWRKRQSQLRADWRLIAKGDYLRDAGALAQRLQQHQRDMGRLDLLTNRLYWCTALLIHYLYFDLWLSLPRDRVRLCAWPKPDDHPTWAGPYFIAYPDLRQKYCSEHCAHEADKKSKRESIAKVREEARKQERARKRTRKHSSGRKQ